MRRCQSLSSPPARTLRARRQPGSARSSASSCRCLRLPRAKRAYNIHALCQNASRLLGRAGRRGAGRLGKTGGRMWIWAVLAEIYNYGPCLLLQHHHAVGPFGLASVAGRGAVVLAAVPVPLLPAPNVSGPMACPAEAAGVREGSGRVRACLGFKILHRFPGKNPSPPIQSLLGNAYFSLKFESVMPRFSLSSNVSTRSPRSPPSTAIYLSPHCPPLHPRKTPPLPPKARIAPALCPPHCVRCALRRFAAVRCREKRSEKTPDSHACCNPFPHFCPAAQPSPSSTVFTTTKQQRHAVRPLAAAARTHRALWSSGWREREREEMLGLAPGLTSQGFALLPCPALPLFAPRPFALRRLGLASPVSARGPCAAARRCPLVCLDLFLLRRCQRPFL